MPSFDEIAQVAVIAVLKDCPQQTYNDIAAKLNLKETTLRKALRNLEDTGKISKIKNVHPVRRSPINRYSLIDANVEPIVSDRAANSRTPSPMDRCCRCQQLKEIAVYRQTQKWCKECAKVLGLSNHATKISR